MVLSPTLNESRYDCRFRIAGAADIESVVTLVEAAYRGDASRAGWTTEADLLDGQRTDASEVRALIGGGDSVILLAERVARLLGCCHLERRGPSTAYFGLFAVQPAEQGRGVGRSLITEAAGRARRWGCSEMRMTVIRQRSDLIAWYRSLGFDPTGETEPFPYGDERFGRPRRDDLEFVVLAASLSALNPERSGYR